MTRVRAGHLRLVLLLDAAALGAAAAALVLAVGLPLAARGALRPAAVVALALGAAAVVLAVGAALLLRSVGAPVDRLLAAADSLGRGAAGELPVLAPPEEAGRGLSRAAVAFERLAAALAGERSRLAEKVAELERANAELVRARESLLRAERLATVGRLAAGIAHEVGNPLGAITGYVELARDRLAAVTEGVVGRPTRMADDPPAPPRSGGEGRGEGAVSRAAAFPPSPPRSGGEGRGEGVSRPRTTTTELDDFLARIAAEAQRIDRTVRDLLDLARPAEPVLGAVDLADPLDAALRLARVQARFRGVEVEVALAPGLPRVVADERRLSQVFLNLFLNAGDAMGGAGKVRVDARLDGDAVAVRIADSGPGIAVADLPRIFEPFFTTKGAGLGTGLGLALSQGIVESFGGDLTAGNGADGGAVFAIRLRPAGP